MDVSNDCYGILDLEQIRFLSYTKASITEDIFSFGEKSHKNSFLQFSFPFEEILK